MRAIHLNDGWYLEFDGELYGSFKSAEEALAFDDREMTDEEADKYRVTKLTE